MDDFLHTNRYASILTDWFSSFIFFENFLFINSMLVNHRTLELSILVP